ncbi:MAG TPA: tRNA adenosine deaminase-associated protein [Mycobacteriales bacterium]|jgi:putative tRNA adenosine deaminase-associated protein|nr:tRNA adenosine deaminase-associated protein [Mycobacteriales bacterium]
MAAVAGGFALMVLRVDGQWQLSPLPEALLDDLDGLLDALRQQSPHEIPIGLVDVEDEFFVALRPGRDGEDRVLLSDVTAAADYDLAADVLDMLGEDTPEDLEDVSPAGDLDLFADLGLPEFELAAILDDLDLYADEMLQAIAGRLGFAEALAATVDTVPR